MFALITLAEAQGLVGKFDCRQMADVQYPYEFLRCQVGLFERKGSPFETFRLIAYSENWDEALKVARKRGITA